MRGVLSVIACALVSGSTHAELVDLVALDTQGNLHSLVYAEMSPIGDTAAGLALGNSGTALYATRGLDPALYYVNSANGNAAKLFDFDLPGSDLGTVLGLDEGPDGLLYAVCGCIEDNELPDYVIVIDRISGSTSELKMSFPGDVDVIPTGFLHRGDGFGLMPDSDGRLWEVNLDTGEASLLVEDLGFIGYGMASSDLGSFISSTGNLYEIDPLTGETYFIGGWEPGVFVVDIAVVPAPGAPIAFGAMLVLARRRRG